MKKIKRAYYYLFYKLYKMSEAAPARFWSDWKAGVAIIALEIWLIISLINYYNVLLNPFFQLKRNVLILLVLVICIINYMAFVHSDIWKNYVAEFDRLPKETNKKGGWIVFGVIAFIIINLIFSYYLMSQVDWSQYR